MLPNPNEKHQRTGAAARSQTRLEMPAASPAVGSLGERARARACVCALRYLHQLLQSGALLGGQQAGVEVTAIAVVVRVV